MSYYILNEDKTTAAVDVETYEQWWHKNLHEGRIVEKTKVGDVEVSTVFLGIDHGWNSEIPILFETLVFGGEYDELMNRYYTWEQAVEGHHEICRKVFAE